MERIKSAFLKQIRRPPDHPSAKKLAKRFKDDAADSYFRFMTESAVHKGIVAMIFFFCVFSPLHADTLFWSGGAGGLWQDTANWTEAAGTSVPGVDYWYIPG